MNRLVGTRIRILSGEDPAVQLDYSVQSPIKDRDISGITRSQTLVAPLVTHTGTTRRTFDLRYAPGHMRACRHVALFRSAHMLQSEYTP